MDNLAVSPACTQVLRVGQEGRRHWPPDVTFPLCRSDETCYSLFFHAARQPTWNENSQR
jgi:hypothetical protein